MIGLVGISQDITARKNAEAALFESEALLRSIADGVPISILRWDRHFGLRSSIAKVRRSQESHAKN